MPDDASGSRSSFEPVRTMADLDTLDPSEIMQGYLDYAPDDPEPGPNRGRAYWHGWRNAAIDRGRFKPDDASCALAHEYLSALRQGRQL